MARKNLDDMVEAPESQALVVTEQEQQPAPGKSYSFGAAIEFESDDVVYPKLRLAQGLTAEVSDGTARPGQFVMTGFEAINSATLVPLGVAKSRRYTQGRGEDYQVLCSSADAKFGHGNPGGSCAACPKSKPQPDPKNPDRKIVPCVLSYSFVAYCTELDTLVEVEFKRTSLGVAKQLNTFIMMNGAGNFAVELKSKQQKSGGNTFYIPVVSMAKVDQDVFNHARSLMPSGLADEYDPDLEAAS